MRDGANPAINTIVNNASAPEVRRTHEQTLGILIADHLDYSEAHILDVIVAMCKDAEMHHFAQLAANYKRDHGLTS